MPDEKDKLIEEHIASLPQYVKDALKAAQPFEKIRKAVTDFQLHIDQGERLEQEVFLVMLGLASPDTFINTTVKSFGLTDEDSKKLVDRIVSELFMPIRDAMRRYMEERAQAGDTEESEESTAPTSVTLEAVPSAQSAQTLQQQLSGAPTSLSQTLPKIERVQQPAPAPTPAIPVSTPAQPATVTPAAPAVSPAPQAGAGKPSLAGIDNALTKVHIASVEKIDVGIAPAKSTYKVDPYLEPPV